LVAAKTAARRRRNPWPVLWLGLIPLAPILAACFDLQKVDPGQRVIADFENDGGDGGLTAAWNRFGPVNCGTFMGSDQNLGQAGTAGTQADPDGSVTCTTERPGDGDNVALKAVFELNQPLGSNQPAGAAVVIRATPGSTVDLTAFQEIWFDAFLESAQQPLQLPSTTILEVELGCSTNISDRLASQSYGELGNSWPPNPLHLPLDNSFRVTLTPHSQNCLDRVDSIHFTILPGLADGTSAGGTLHLDNITLQN
jgi:hypothetical protein